MGNIFQNAPGASLSKSRHDLSHSYGTTGQFGQLIPTLVMDVLPGDEVDLGCQSLTRLQPMVFPPMHKMDITHHYWYVPYRILWDNATDFFSLKEDAAGNLPVMPYLEIDPSNPNDYTPLMNYMRIPRIDATTGQDQVVEEINALAFAAYQCVYHERYRDQNLVPEFNYKLVDGLNTNQELKRLRLRALQHDFFTAASPEPQYGQEVQVAGGIVKLAAGWANQGTPLFVDSAGNPATGSISAASTPPPVVKPIIAATPSGGAPTQVAYDPRNTLEVDPIDITELRTATKLQQFKERLMRTGRRWKEFIQGVFGVNLRDSRVQDPEFIVGTTTPIVTSEVLTTAATANAPAGAMTGHGISVNGGRMGHYKVHEHGVIICLTCARPATAYQQGIPKQFLKRDPLDYFLPDLAHVGMQAIFNNELFAFAQNNKAVFGYQNKYEEHRYMPSTVTGDMQTVYSSYHLARKFANMPQLNQQFIECNPSAFNRIFAIQNGSDYLIIYIYHTIKVRSLVPKYGDPKFM